MDPSGSRNGGSPQDRVFFNWFDEAATSCQATADALQDLFTKYDSIAERRQRIKDLEHKGDSLTHNLFDALSRSSILPLDREDISAPSKATDDIVNYIYAITNRPYLYDTSDGALRAPSSWPGL